MRPPAPGGLHLDRIATAGSYGRLAAPGSLASERSDEGRPVMARMLHCDEEDDLFPIGEFSSDGRWHYVDAGDGIRVRHARHRAPRGDGPWIPTGTILLPPVGAPEYGSPASRTRPPR
jgi:hypothetical protein